MKENKLYNPDLETLKRWKKAPAKAKLQWLSDALEFFAKPKKVIKPSR